jgi:unsaturated chondroitin disaccharide hydrolase
MARHSKKYSTGYKLFFRNKPIVIIYTAIISCCLFFFSCGSSDGIPDFTTSNTGPYILNIEHLELIRDTLESDPVLQESYNRLMHGAEHLLHEEFEFVTDKTEAPPGGTKNDYKSIHPYIHLDSDGDPYYDESFRNPHVDNFDRLRLERFSSAVYTLSLAYFFSGNENYAEKAAGLLKGWFFDPNTKMNPNLNFAQVQLGIPGTGGGGTQGIIDANDFINVIEAVSLLYDSHHWTGEDHKQLKDWFYHFSDWIIKNYNSNSYCEDEIYCSNISTWADVQKASYFLFTEQNHLLNSARHIMPVETKIRRQFGIDGLQTNEKNRARSQHYVYYNLRAYMNLATIRKNRTENDRDWQVFDSYNYGGLKPAIDNLVEYVNDQNTTTHFNPNPAFDECRYLEIFKPAAIVFDSRGYNEAANELLNRGCISSNISLTYPSLELLGS